MYVCLTKPTGHDWNYKMEIQKGRMNKINVFTKRFKKKEDFLKIKDNCIETLFRPKFQQMQDVFVTDEEGTIGKINGCLQEHATNAVDRKCEQRSVREMDTG